MCMCVFPVTPHVAVCTGAGAGRHSLLGVAAVLGVLVGLLQDQGVMVRVTSLQLELVQLLRPRRRPAHGHQQQNG